MQYPHRGGFRFQLFNADGRLVEYPSVSGRTGPHDEFDVHSDPTAESESLRFENACEGCVLRLERQALEWGDSYRFRSCAEVNIRSEVCLNSF